MEACTGTCKTNAEHMERHTQGLGCVGDQFVKHDMGKTRYDLIPPEVLQALAEQLTYGASKYRPDNWKQGTADRYYSALMRHIEAMRRGEKFDEEGRPHCFGLMANAAFLTWFDLQETDS